MRALFYRLYFFIFLVIRWILIRNTLKDLLSVNNLSRMFLGILITLDLIVKVKLYIYIGIY